MNELDSFLKEEQGVGLIDSTGQFTISADKALEKLAHSQLPDPSYWILKVVQFATSYGVETMEVKIGRRVTSIEMPLPTPLSVAQMQHGLDSVEPLPEPALDHLVTGLRALGGIESKIFVLNLKGPDSSEFLFWDGKRLSTKRQDHESDGASLILEISSAGSTVWNLDLAARFRRAGEALALETLAFVAPLQLKVDGRVVTHAHLEQPGHFVQSLLWDHAPFEQGTDLPFYLKSDSEMTGPASAFWSLSFNYKLVHSAFRSTPDPREVERTSRIYWVKDGVIVKQNALIPKLPFTVNLFVDCRDCPADLGGLNLRQTDIFTAKRRWVMKELLPGISRKSRESIKNLRELEGKTLGGWEAVVASTSHLPLSDAVVYEKPNPVGKSLNAHPGFRKKLLALIKETASHPAARFLPDSLSPK